jgi:hypothetical protein
MKAVRTEIAITGIAAISSAGVGLDPLIETLRSGISALRPVPVDLAGEEGHVWGRAEEFKASDFMSPKRKFVAAVSLPLLQQAWP